MLKIYLLDPTVPNTGVQYFAPVQQTEEKRTFALGSYLYYTQGLTVPVIVVVIVVVVCGVEGVVVGEGGGGQHTPAACVNLVQHLHTSGSHGGNHYVAYREKRESEFLGGLLLGWLTRADVLVENSTEPLVTLAGHQQS